MFKVEYCVVLNSYDNTTTVLSNYNFDSIRFYAKNIKLALQNRAIFRNCFCNVNQKDCLLEFQRSVS